MPQFPHLPNKCFLFETSGDRCTLGAKIAKVVLRESISVRILLFSEHLRWFTTQDICNIDRKSKLQKEREKILLTLRAKTVHEADHHM